MSDRPIVTVEAVRDLLRGVVDPELGADIVDLGMAKDIHVDGGTVEITIALTTAGCPLRAQIQRDARARVASLPGVDSVSFTWTELSGQEKAAVMERARRRAQEDAPETRVPAHTRILAIASGKGGVGKSSVTVNLAAALAHRGLCVGVLDADIWGFSVPRMLGMADRLEADRDHDGSARIQPNEQRIGEGMLRVVSMGFLVEDETDALMWRGLMLNRAVQHFLEDVEWGDLDYLLIDLPPGTGDVQMGLARLLPRTELLVVTTPARAAQKVAERAVTMARKSNLRVVGVIENMTAFTCEHGTPYALFGEGGGAALAASAGVPLLGQIPLEPSVASGGDTGTPQALSDGAAATAFAGLAEVIVTEAAPPVDVTSCSARLLDAVDAALDAAGL